MQNFEAILKEYGIELPDDKKAEINKKISENYLTIAEVNKKYKKLETERDGYKDRAETAEATLEELGDVKDIKTLQTQVETWKEKAETAENNYNAKIREREYADAINTEIESLKFTSDAAKRDVIAQIKQAELKLKDGKLLGFSDLIAQIKESDKSAFVDEQQQNLEQNKTRVITRNDGGGNKATYKSKDEILAIKDRTERRQAIADNMQLFSTEE